MQEKLQSFAEAYYFTALELYLYLFNLVEHSHP